VIAGFRARAVDPAMVEAALVEALGEQAAVSKSTVVADLRRDQDPVRGVERPPPRRRRAGLPVFWTAATSNITPNASAEPVLAGWGIDTRRQTGVCRAGGRVVGVR